MRVEWTHSVVTVVAWLGVARVLHVCLTTYQTALGHERFQGYRNFHGFRRSQFITGFWDRHFEGPSVQLAQVAHVLVSALNHKSHTPSAVKQNWSPTRVALWAIICSPESLTCDCDWRAPLRELEMIHAQVRGQGEWLSRQLQLHTTH
eukprot:5232592-Amphidinium_carterae.1